MNINQWLLSALRAKAEQIDVILPESSVYQALCGFLDNCSTDQLELIKEAKIKWVSTLAINLIKSRAMA